jgi:two-component system chemotaxis sensor kinase CheA
MRLRARERNLCPIDELESMDDKQVLDLIFRPGFSTAEQISEVSGRGVGMDVVRQAIVTKLKGSIDIDSIVGEGTTFTLRLPLTLAIIQVLLARTGGAVFAIPLDSVLTTTTCRVSDIQLIQDREVLALRDRQVPLIRLNRVLELPTTTHAASDELHIVLTDVHGESYGLICENLIGKKEIVIKSLGDILKNVPCAAGATLLGDRCAIILDVPEIVARALRRKSTTVVSAPQRVHSEAATSVTDAPHILLVEDSDTVRESLRRLITQAGYRCTTARDGVEGFDAAKSERFDLVSTDVMMPRMDGYELTRALRATPEYRNTPIVMVTSRGERIDRVRGFDAGVDEYITKPHDRHMLLQAIAKLLAKTSEGGS